MTIAIAGREPHMRVLGLVGAVHFMSHFFAQILPPLFPVLNAELGMSYTALGVLMAVKMSATGFLQLPAGVAVDRLGAKRAVLIGLLICSLSVVLMGTVTTPLMLGVLVIVFGIGNSVFHPTNYTILNSSIPEHRMGRAFSFHNLTGQLGTAVAPAVILSLTAFTDWRVAVIASGIVGLIISLLIVGQMGLLNDGVAYTDKSKTGKTTGPAMPIRDVVQHVMRTPALLYLFLFYGITSLASAGVKDFSVAGLVAVQGTPVALAGGAVTGFFFASAIGVIAGGWVADQSKKHDLIAGLSFLTAGIVIGIVGLVDLHATAIVFCFSLAGFVDGMIRPSRDMMVRNAAPAGAVGQIFGFVFSAQTVGGFVAPITYGLILDFGDPAWVFYLSAIFMLLCMVAIAASGRATRLARDRGWLPARSFLPQPRDLAN